MVLNSSLGELTEEQILQHYLNQNKPLAIIKLKRNSDCNNPFPFLHPLFPSHTLFIRLTHSHQQIVEMCLSM